MVMKADVWGAALDAILSAKFQAVANPSAPRNSVRPIRSCRPIRHGCQACCAYS